MKQPWAKETMQKIVEKIRTLVPEMVEYPANYENGKYRQHGAKWWTNGYFPGMLWMAYQQTGDEVFKTRAREIEDSMVHVLDSYYDVDHDLGFIWQLSAGADYNITGDEESKRRMLKAASYLASRFNLAGNFIQAWNWEPGYAIVDCTMNLPLLYWASLETGNPRFRHIAKAHAYTVVDYFVRPDGSVNHICSFDPETGEFIEPIGGQGNAPDSAWARGTTWALYGLALSYRFTGEEEFLTTAKRVANFYLANLPEDHVAHWDFRVERTPETARDSSAASCGACGLLEIAKHVPECEKAVYEDAACKILKSLTDNYTNLENEEQGLLRMGTGHHPAGKEINTSLIYGDYYYVEGISRLMGNDKILEYGPNFQ